MSSSPHERWDRCNELARAGHYLRKARLPADRLQTAHRCVTDSPVPERAEPRCRITRSSSPSFPPWPKSTRIALMTAARSRRLYRRVFGTDAAEASRLRWDWQYRAQSQQPRRHARSSGSRAKGRRSWASTRRCRCGCRCDGREVDASWGMDVMVAPERQRQGIGEVLFRTWDRHTSARRSVSGCLTSSHRLFQKLRWPEPGPVPCLVKPLTRRAFTPAELAREREPARVGGHAAPRQGRVAHAPRCAPRSRYDPALSRPSSRRSGNGWRRSSTSPSGATRAYLNWKYVEATARAVLS